MPIEMIGAKDRFGQVGTVDFLKEEYHMTALDIIDAARKSIGRKNK